MSAHTGSERIIRFGGFEADLDSGELRKDAARIRLQEQPFQVLTLLLQRPGQVVTREEIRKTLWPADTFVDFDHGLNKAMNRLREALGDSADAPRFIETLPKRGYRFVAPLEAASGVHGRPRRPWLLLTAMTLIAGAGSAYFLTRRTPALNERDTVVLADFENRTGDSAFDFTLKQAVQISLEASSFITTLTDQKIADTLRLMHRAPDERVTTTVAREVCRRTGSKAVIGGSVTSVGSGYVVGVTAMNCQAGDTIAQHQVQAARKEEVLDRLTAAVADLRATLGESLSAMPATDTRVHNVLSTSSLDAFEMYTNGERMVLRGRSPIPLFERAVELDPEFAYAHAALGLLYGTIGETARSSESSQRAYRLRNRVSDWEQFFITAQYYLRVTGEIEKVLPVCQSWIQRYPRDRTAHNRLAQAYRQLGLFEQALAEYQAARSVGGDHPVDLVDAATTLIELDRPDEAMHIVRDALHANPEDRRFHRLAYLVSALGSDARAGRAEIEWARSNGSAAEVLVAHAGVEAAAGRLAASRELTLSLADTARRAGREGNAALWVAGLAAHEMLLGDANPSRRDASAAIAVAPGWEASALSGLVLAGTGASAAARTIADRLAADFPANSIVRNYWLPVIHSEIELASHNPTQAIDLLRASASLELAETAVPLIPVYVRGRAYLQAKRATDAAAEFNRILAHRGLIAGGPLGPLARLGLARAHMLAGDTRQARSDYQDVLEAWNDADTGLPILEVVRAEFAILR